MRAVAVVAALLGLVSLVLAVVYFLTPAASLPSFLPGFQPGEAAIHVKHAIGSLVAAIAFFVVAGFLGRRA